MVHDPTSTACPSESDAPLALAAKALSHPARLAILRAIAKDNRCNCAEICGNLPLAQSTVSQHLQVLKEARLITFETDGPNSRFMIATAAINEFVDQLTALARGLCVARDACCGGEGCSDSKGDGKRSEDRQAAGS